MTESEDRGNARSPKRDPVKRRPRDGGAEAARKIAEAGDDNLVWPEFPNADDADLRW
jgi:antitoxin MazE